MGLTQKQQVFVETYLRLWNATAAAIEAGYSEKTAYSIGSENLKKPEIRAAIAARIESLKMSADEVLVRQAEIARSSMADFAKVNPDSGAIGFDFRKAQTQGKLHLLKKLKLAPTEWGLSVEIELYDAQRAQEMMLKVHRLLVERVEVDWRRELKDAGIDPDEAVDGLAAEFVEHIRRGAEGAGRGGVEAGEGTDRH